MATLSVTNPTLADWSKVIDPNGSIAQVIGLLSQMNEITDDMVWNEGNLPTGHRTSVQTSLPTGTWRRFNEGIVPTKSTSTQITDSCGMLETYSEIDKALADLNGNTATYRLSEDRAFLEGLTQQLAGVLFYGNTATNPERFMGFSPRYNTTSTATSQTANNFISGGGAGSDNTSIWLVGWGDLTVHGIFPKGSKAGLSMKDLGEQTLLDASGNRFQGYRTHYKWDAGLAGIAGTIPRLAALKDQYLAQAIGPRQKALLEPLIDRRLDRAGGDLGRIAEQATSVLDDRIVAERIADLQQDASLAWHDPAHLRTLGRTTVGELRYQGERKGWDARQTDTAVRTGLSDLYAGAVEAALGQDPERAAKLYDHARDVIQPERQAAVERKIERAREERRVTEIVGGLADTPDDPARRPDSDDYQARAAELTPPDASPEVRAQVTRMARIEQARADRAWQAARGRAATGALDWLGTNPAAPLMAMPAELRDGLSPEQTEALDRTAINGGRLVTDRDLYEKLDDQAVNEPENFTGIDLTQHRLSLGDSDYNRLIKIQKTLADGKSDPTFERHRLGRLFLGEGLRDVNVDPDAPEARTARQQLDRLLGAFEPVEGKPPTMADIRGLVGDVVGGMLSSGEGDPNIVRTSGGEPVEADRETDISQRPEQQLAQADGLPFIPAHMWTRIQQKGISPGQIDDALKGKRMLQPNGNTACIGAAVIVILSPSGGFVTCYWK